MQTALLVPRIAALGHDITINAPYSMVGAPLRWNGHLILPRVNAPLERDGLVWAYRHAKADLAITLCDVAQLRWTAPALKEMRLAHWVPIDCRPAGEDDVYVLHEGKGRPIAMSYFGRDELRAAGCDPLYVPHGVDAAVFCPTAPAHYRQAQGVDPDTFVIGINGRNTRDSRKALPEQVTAFARFHDRHPDSMLFVHTHATAADGLDLVKLVRHLGIEEAVTMPDEYSYAAGLITREALATWYSSLDVLSNCSYAEGFGLAALEAQACGKPVITTDASAMRELCGAGWLVAGDELWVGGHNAWWLRPRVAEIDRAYEMAWVARERGAMSELAARARTFAMNYEADRVVSHYWAPVLAELEARL